MSIPNDYREFLSSLAELTDKARVNWKFDGHAVEVLIENERIVVWAGTDERSDQAFVSFALRDKSGNTIDTWYLDDGDGDFDFMNRFFLSAKRHALGVPDRLKRLRESLTKDGVVGKE